MVWGILILIFLAVFGFFLYLFLQSLKNNLENLQRNLLLEQKENEKANENRTAQLRVELTGQMQQNRHELQDGLFKSVQTLDAKLNDLTKGMTHKLEQNLKDGFLQFEKVQDHLKKAEVQLLNLNQVGRSINELNDLLKMPHLRGNFGEALLEKILSDILPADSFQLQYQITPHSTERVDAVVKYPQALLPIDSKFPRETLLPLFQTQNQAELEAARKQLNDVMKGLAKQIREKYIRPDQGTTDMALLFVPSETLYFEVLRSPTLCEDLARQKVFVVSPNTLTVTLHAIAVAKNYYDMAKGVEKTILEVKKAQQHFENFEKRFDEVGTALGKAQNAFSTATTHLGRYESAVKRLTGDAPEETVVAPLQSPPSSVMLEKEL